MASHTPGSPAAKLFSGGRDAGCLEESITGGVASALLVCEMEVRDYMAGIAVVVSVVSLALSIFEHKCERIEAVIEGLRGGRRSVTCLALTVRLPRLLKRRGYRRSLVASLLLGWNFETLDRARARATHIDP